MPRKPLGARLYLRKERNGDKVWIIRDMNNDARTGFKEHQRDEAEALLADYLAGRFRPKRKRPTGFIYFVTCLSSANYPIKIGWACTPMDTRLAGLQNGNPNLLTVVGMLAGTMEDEKKLHTYFGHLRIRGEWFIRNGELIDYIGGLPGQVETYGAEEFELSSNARAQLQRHQPTSSENETGAIAGTERD